MNMEIGTSLYRYVRCGGIFEYKVIGIRVYEDNTQYELESQTCTHGWKCKLLVGGAADKLRYISMTNDDEENSQHYWHTDDTKFRFKKEEAELDLIAANSRILKENIEKTKELLARQQSELKRYEGLAAIAKEKLKPYLEEEI